MALRCAFAALILAGLLGWAAPAAHAQSTVHIVQPGENLFRIGLRYGVSWQTLMAVNGLTSTYIVVGQRLVIPTGGNPASPAPPPPPPPAPAAPDPPPAPHTYVVAPGDTAWRIATRFGVTVSALAAANGLFSPQWISVGQTLVIPTAEAAAAPPPPAGRQLVVYGRPQTWPLTCESRSAADWAGYFGVYIDELTFFGQLPRSDDPEAGFVGSAFGLPGQLPPYDYGVHAPPVAALLNAYGLRASAVRGVSWDYLRAEIDAGRPVIAWVTRSVQDGVSYLYTAASTGVTTVVAPYEHTVIVTGYSGDVVTVLDGGLAYSVSLAQFVRSWAALGFQAIVAGG